MKIDHFIGRFVFLGNERLAEEICTYMRTLALTDLEECILCQYLALPRTIEIRKAFGMASPQEREIARRVVMAKFPKEWPPAEPYEFRSISQKV